PASRVEAQMSSTPLAARTPTSCWNSCSLCCKAAIILRLRTPEDGTSALRRSALASCSNARQRRSHLGEQKELTRLIARRVSVDVPSARPRLHSNYEVLAPFERPSAPQHAALAMPRSGCWPRPCHPKSVILGNTPAPGTSVSSAATTQLI